MYVYMYIHISVCLSLYIYCKYYVFNVAYAVYYVLQIVFVHGAVYVQWIFSCVLFNLCYILKLYCILYFL